MTGISVLSVGIALKKTAEKVDDRKTPVMGVMAAFIFAAQMVSSVRRSLLRFSVCGLRWWL